MAVGRSRWPREVKGTLAASITLRMPWFKVHFGPRPQQRRRLLWLGQFAPPIIALYLCSFRGTAGPAQNFFLSKLRGGAAGCQEMPLIMTAIGLRVESVACERTSPSHFIEPIPNRCPFWLIFLVVFPFRWSSNVHIRAPNSSGVEKTVADHDCTLGRDRGSRERAKNET